MWILIEACIPCSAPTVEGERVNKKAGVDRGPGTHAKSRKAAVTAPTSTSARSKCCLACQGAALFLFAGSARSRVHVCVLSCAMNVHVFERTRPCMRVGVCAVKCANR